MKYWFCAYDLNGKKTNGVSETDPVDQRASTKEWTNEAGQHGNSNLLITFAMEITAAQFRRYRKAEMEKINKDSS